MTDAAAEYRERRERDWQAFVDGAGPPADYWAGWEERSLAWRPALILLQPVGRDHPTLLEPVQPLLDTLAELEEVDLPPIEFVHLPTLVIGFLASKDISYTQMETICLYASASIVHAEPFSIRVGGISIHEDGLYLGVDDGFRLRDVRRLAAEGAPRVAEALRAEVAASPDGRDDFVPSIPFAYFTGSGDRRRVVEAVEPYRDAELDEYAVRYIGMGRVLSDEQIHYADLDVMTEVPLRGQ